MSPNNTLKKRVFVKVNYIYKNKKFRVYGILGDMGDIQRRDNDSREVLETIRVGAQYDTEA